MPRPGNQLGVLVLVGAAFLAVQHARDPQAAGAPAQPIEVPAATPEWVVESSTFQRNSGAETWSVVCIPATEQAVSYEDRSQWREIRTDETTADSAVPGQPCPTGPVVAESP